MISRIKSRLDRETFFPTILSIFVNPFYFIRRGLYRGLVSNAALMHGVMLDFGCGSKPYKELFNVQEYIGLDIEESGHEHTNEQIDVFYDGVTIPFEDNHFDSVFSSEVFEHIFNLNDIIDELLRVMKPEAKLLLTLPFVWDEHEIPYDFARYTSFGISYILEGKGFKVIKLEKSTSYVETVFQMWSAYVAQHILPSNPYLRLILIPLLISPIIIFGIIFSKILPRSESFYCNNIVVAEKKNTQV